MSAVGVMVTCWLHWAVFPDVSEAVQPMVCTPTPKKVPGAIEGSTLAMPQLSVAEAVPNWLAAMPHPEVLTDTSGGQLRVTFSGQVMEGGMLSFTVTVQLHDALFPEPSVAV